MHQLNDPWAQVLDQFFDIDKPKISLYLKGKKWNIRIASVKPEIYNWANSILSKWHNVNIKHDHWNSEHYEFKTRRDAEKFITLFNLKWAQ